jgi:hypothetical protein
LGVLARFVLFESFPAFFLSFHALEACKSSRICRFSSCCFHHSSFLLFLVQILIDNLLIR